MSAEMQQYIDEAEQALLHTYNRYQVVFDRGEGVYLYDMDGKKYLDFVSGIAVFNLSRFAEPGDTLRIDLLPRMDAPMLEQLLLERRSRLFARAGSCTGDDVLRGMVLPAVGRGVLKAAGLRAEGPFGKRDARGGAADSR